MVSSIRICHQLHTEERAKAAHVVIVRKRLEDVGRERDRCRRVYDGTRALRAMQVRLAEATARLPQVAFQHLDLEALRT